MATPTSTMSADPLLSNQRKEYHPGPSNAGSSGSQQDPGLDGHDVDPIAVCGFAIKFPEDATTPERLWQMLLDKRCVSSDFPPERCNPEGFYQKNSRMNTIPLKGGHFIKEDLSKFDADFFSISPTEAASLDPLQRWLLEVAYAAIENAGISMEAISGSSTAVYTGYFGVDHVLQLCRDPENPPPYAALGFGLSMLANRLSWFFNLHGPSIGVDSACSSTAMALDMACRSIRDGSCESAIVAGANIASAPETYSWMTNLNFLSPDSKCYSFDSRANGYARGEGLGVVILKKLSDAIREGCTIRAVIRATGSNEDGKTPGITQPSREAQERLIRDTYRKAGLSMEPTRFFEAHGTGTPIGDPREAQAIGNAFRLHRSPEDPLYVGALKSNIGHLEGASGLAGLIKAILALERGVIPPNANLERVNPRIDTDYLRISFPQEAQPWPTKGLRRASVNSFGYGGANSHVIIDDAFNYMKLRGLDGKHATSPLPPEMASIERPSKHLGSPAPAVNGSGHDGPAPTAPKLLVWSAADKNGIGRMTEALRGWFGSLDPVQVSNPNLLADLALTLDSHRSRLSWRSFALLNTAEDLRTLPSLTVTKAKADPARIGFVFSGQGAQWFGMGRELLCYQSFREDIDRAGNVLNGLGCPWSPIVELSKSEQDSNVNKPEFSQTLCTVLQLALVNLLRRLNVQPAAVIGHSSGEIAAAYAAGGLSYESALSVAYFRGVCSAELVQDSISAKTPGSMMSIGLSESEAKDHIASINRSAVSFGLSVACVNSPSNVTISGEEQLIDMLQEVLQQRDEKVFSRKLLVPVAYHSRQMESMAAKYTSMLGTLFRPDPEDTVEPVPMISSVTGERVSPDNLVDPRYWALNMTSTVQFSKAVTTMVAQAELVKKLDGSHKFASVVDHLIELGPHSALQSPIRSILSSSPRGPSISYSSVIRRGKPATDTLLRVVGELYCMGLSPDLRRANEPAGKDTTSRSLLVHLPEYPFDHSKSHWHENRLSRRFRLRPYAPAELQGVMTPDSRASHARWRHYIRLSESPWAEHHIVNGSTLYPAAGMIVFAIEAAKQLIATHSTRHIDSFTLRDVRFEAPLDLSASAGAGQLEVETSLYATAAGSGQSVSSFDFVIRSFYENDEEFVACRGSISVDLSSPGKEAEWERSRISEQRETIATQLRSMVLDTTVPVDSQRMYKFLEDSGFAYGPPFQNLHEQRCTEGNPRRATAEVELFSPGPDPEPHVIHPATLDAVFHLCFTALTAGGQQPMATAVPSRVGCLWVSSTGLSQPGSQTVTACSSIQKLTKRGESYDGGAFGSGPDMGVRVWFEGLETTNITSLPQKPALSSLPDGQLAFSRPDQFCMTVSSKVALDKLSPNEVCSVLDSMDKNEPSPFHADIDVYLLVALERLVSEVDFQSIDEPAQWQRQYWKWATHHLDRFRQYASLGWNDPQSRLNQARANLKLVGEGVASTGYIGRVFVKVASNLSKLFRGEIDPLDFLMRSGMLDDFYRHLADTQVADYVDLLAHQNPGLKILEVGGGTGGTTRRIIDALSSGRTSSLRCGRYDFTDISFGFCEKMREEFASALPQMAFGKLDVEKDIVEQGYEAGTYDVVVADNVLHATQDIPTTLRQIRKALKPGGKIVLNENFYANGWKIGFIFGLLPGWWLGADRGRELSPLLSPEDWDISLKATGFSGTEIVLEKVQADGASLVVSTAVAEEGSPSDLSRPSVLLRGKVFIVVNNGSVQQQSLANTLCSTLGERFGQTLIVLGLDVAVAEGHARSPEDLVVSLLDCGSPFLCDLTEISWKALQGLIGQSHRVLWLSGGGGKDPSPNYGIVDGLARTLRFERYDLQFVTLGLDLCEATEDPSQSMRHVVDVVRDMEQARGQDNYEQDYTVVDDRLHIRRLVEANHVKTAMQQSLQPTKTIPAIIKDSRFQVSFEPVSGHDRSPYYEEMQPWKGAPGADEVEVSVKAVSLQPSERPAAQGHTETPQLGDFCSGVVVHAGSSSGFHPGDRVVVAQAGSLRSHLRAPSRAVALVSPAMSFADVCATVPPLVAAHHALVDVGRVRPGDSVLIYGVDGPVGYAIVDLLAHLDVTDVWATMTGQDGSEKDTFAAEILHGGLPKDRLIPHSWVDNPSILSSPWKRRFDTVVSPYPVSQEPLNLFCLRSGGRYILLQTRPSNGSHQMRDAPPSASLSIVPRSTIAQSVESLRYVTADLHNFRQRSAGSSHTTLFPAPKLDDALARLQHVTERDSVIITYESEDTIQLRTPNEPNLALRADATYLIAGGFGGLGRALARWLVDRGARFLILISRSGASKPEAKALLAELESRGVRIEGLACDVADSDRLRGLLDECAQKMPPVAGCIQATMVMTERVFQGMTFEDWSQSVNPKVKGSWNLDQVLPKGMDFFVVLSSVMGILGTASLAGYNAGNTFKDAFARHRTSQGERTISLDLGTVPDEGYLAGVLDTDMGRAIGLWSKRYARTYFREICGLLDLCCDPSQSFFRTPDQSQCVLGLRPPSHWKHLEEVPTSLCQPFWGHMHHIPLPESAEARGEPATKGAGPGKVVETAVKLATSGSLAEASEMASKALAIRVAGLLGSSKDSIELQNPMDSYGLDSLSAIHVRNWVGKMFSVDMPVFEILGGATFIDAGESIARKVQSSKPVA